MRRRLRKFLPLLLIALAVQIFAPIAACWAAGIAASDPLAAAVICHGNGSSNPDQGDQGGSSAHDGCCSACTVMQTGAPVDSPETTVVPAELPSARVAWRDFEARSTDGRAGNHAQARAPPSFS